MLWLASIVLIPLVVIYGNYSGRLLLNISVGVKRITEGVSAQRGDVYWDGNVLRVKFLWTEKRFSLSDITKISGYSDEDFAQDFGDEFVEVRFGKRNTVVFNANNKTQVHLLNQFALAKGVDFVDDWSEACYPGTENEPVVFYKKREKK